MAVLVHRAALPGGQQALPQQAPLCYRPPTRPDPSPPAISPLFSHTEVGYQPPQGLPTHTPTDTPWPRTTGFHSSLFSMLPAPKPHPPTHPPWPRSRR